MDEYLYKSISNNESFDFIFIGLDGFKKINDNFGYLFGDYALSQIGKCLNKHLDIDDLLLSPSFFIKKVSL